ncbi:MAG: hypothetical protein ACR2JF_18230 [Iamia sp.]
MTPSYVIARDEHQIASVVEDQDGVLVVTSTGSRHHASLTSALEAERELTTIDGTGSWSIECADMAAWTIADRLVGEASEVLLNDTLWLPYGREVKWVPEDPYELSDDAATVAVSFKSPGSGSPGGSPSWALVATKVGGLWHASSSEALDIAEPWMHETDPSRVAPWLMSLDFFGAVTTITDPSLAPGDAAAVEHIVGRPDENGWTAIWVNDELWTAGITAWEPAGDHPLGVVSAALDRPLSIHLCEPPRWSGGALWRHFEESEVEATRDTRLTPIVVVPSTAPDRDLVRIVHADASHGQSEVGHEPATAVIVDAGGSEWVGVAWARPDLAAQVVRAVPGAVVLQWDDEGDLLVCGGAVPLRRRRWWLQEIEGPPPSAARRMDELDPMGSWRFTDDMLGYH